MSLPKADSQQLSRRCIVSFYLLLFTAKIDQGALLQRSLLVEWLPYCASLPVESGRLFEERRKRSRWLVGSSSHRGRAETLLRRSVPETCLLTPTGPAPEIARSRLSIIGGPLF